MRKIYMLLMTVIVISACGKGDDNKTCICQNSDFEVVGTYSGVSESECASHETGDITCTLE